MKRAGEKLYDLKKTNCESFVMWCLCDLNVSLQVTPLRKALLDTGSGVLRSLWHFLQQVCKVVSELVDDFAAATTCRVIPSAKALSLVGGRVGVAWQIRIRFFFFLEFFLGISVQGGKVHEVNPM